MADDLPDAPWAKADSDLPDAPWAKGGDFSWSRAVTDIPKEIASEAKAGAQDVMALGRRGEMGAMEGLMSVPKAVMGAARVPLAPLTGAARSLIGHTMANLEHKAGEYIAPEIAAKDNPEQMYETAKSDVDKALAAARPAGSPIKIGGAYEWKPAVPAQTKPVGVAKQPETEEFFNAADQNYSNMRGFGVEIDPRAMNRVADNILTELHAEGYRPRNAPGVFDAVEELRTPAGANHEISDIDSVRKVLNKARLDPTQRDAARRAINHIDDYLSNLHQNPQDVVVNPHFAKRVSEEATSARANYAVAKRAEDIDEALEQAERQAARAGSGSNINNAIRQRLSALRNNKKKMAGWTDEEKAELDKVIQGTRTANLTRKAGKFSPEGIVSAGMSAGAGHVIAPGVGEFALPAVGWVAKKIADRATRMAAERLGNVVKARSPLGKQTSINAAAQSALSPRTSRPALTSTLATLGLPRPLPQIPRVIMNTAEFSGSKEAEAERRRKREEEPNRNTGGKAHINRDRGGAVHNHNPSDRRFADGGAVRRALDSLKEYAGGGVAGIGKAGGGAFGVFSPGEQAEIDDVKPITPETFAPTPDESPVRFKTASPLVNITEQDINRGMDIGMNAATVTPGRMANVAKAAVPAVPEVGPVWRSAVEDAIETLPMKSAPADQWANTLRNAKGIKPEEMEWLGLQDFFAAKKATGEKVTKQELMDHVAGNRVDIKDVQKGASEEFPLRFRSSLARDLEPMGIDTLNNFTSPADVDAARRFNIQFGETTKGFSNQEVYDAIQEAKTLPDYSGTGIWRNYDTRAEAEEAIRNAHAHNHLEVGEPITHYRDTKYQSYQLPGGENYREHLLTMPQKMGKGDLTGAADFAKSMREKYGERWIGELTPAENARYDQLIEGSPKLEEGYKSPHWDEPNVLAHVRSNDRVMESPEGPKKTLHLEEIQSDWHQKGRKLGYREGEPKTTPKLDANDLRIEQDQHQYIGHAPDGRITRVGKGTVGSEEEAREYIARYMNKNAAEKNMELAQAHNAKVPSAPFKDTDAWAGLAMKRMIREAAEKGYDRISWTPGEAQAARYDLSKQINRIAYNKDEHTLQAFDHKGDMVMNSRTPPDQLADSIGKEAAEKLINSPTNTRKDRYGNWNMLEGVDLKVGGEGMREFYDKMLPKIAEKIGKAHGVKVHKGMIGEKEDWPGQLKSSSIKEQPVWYFDITPKLKEQALKGMSMFQRGGRIKPRKPSDRSVGLRVAYRSKGNNHKV